MSEPHYREGVVFLQVARDHMGRYKLRALKSTQKAPDVVTPGAVVIKLRIRVPDAAFSPLQPEAVVTIPEGFTQHVVEVEAEDLRE